MAGAESPLTQLRCPVCMARDIDVVLRPMGAAGFACIKCSYWGAEPDIRRRYAEARTKYRWHDVRLSPDDLDRI